MKNINVNDNRVRDVGGNKLGYYVAVGLILFMVFMSLPGFCSAQHHHHHDHDHDDHVHENPSFKYSKQANLMDEEEHHHHEHGGHDHHHGHGHDHHGHGHDHHGHGHDHHHHHHDDHHDNNPKDQKAIDEERMWLWIRSLGSTLLISAAPYFILYLIPLDNTEAMQPRLKILLAFASGGLLGDAFLHLIPHAIAPHTHQDDHAHSHDHGHHEASGHGHNHDNEMMVGLWVLAGIIVFLTVEKVVRFIKGASGGHGHSHGAPKQTPKPVDTKKTDDKDKSKKKDEKIKSSKPVKVQEKKDDILIAGYLNLAADFTHNFTDGLAIGASYLAGRGIGIVTTITILLHEVPHEIGDFAILIKSGCSKKKAMMLQLTTAVGALAGTVIALLGSGTDASSSWVLPFTAGGFIYIATVSVLPELLEGSTKLLQSLKEIAALLTGVFLMVLIAKFE